MSSRAVAPPSAGPWIIGRAQDSVLFLGAPVLILAAFWLLQRGVESRSLQYAVLAFGSLGHNLPGMLRAYGDRALFERFRMRFAVAPLGLAAVSTAFVLSGSGGLLLVAYLWAIWHALMQMYGFLRIYDARVGAVAPRIARLDFAMCMAWFGGALPFSDARLYYLQSLAVEFGVGPLSPAGVETLRLITAAVIAGVTLVYLFDLWRRWQLGQSISLLKHVLYVSSVAFWWYVHVVVADVLLGLVMFEVYHDVQYLAIVWVFNRRRAAGDADAGAFTRFLFRRSWSMLALYVGLCLAYGGTLPLVQGAATSVGVQMAMAIFVQTSALLHYYYDGFIWKVRERSTQEALGLDRRAQGDGLARRHALKWLVLGVPVAVLYFAQAQPPSLDDAEALARSTPRAAEAHFQLGIARGHAEQHRESASAFAAALAITPGDAIVMQALARAEVESGLHELRAGRVAEAGVLLTRAAARLPALADHLVASGEQLRHQGVLPEAIILYRAALLVREDFAPAHLDLALALRSAGQREEALVHARRGAALLPNDERAQALVVELQSR